MPETHLEESASVATDLPRGLLLAIAAAQTADSNRGQDIVVLDLRRLTSIVDYFVIATGTSPRQLRAMAEEIDHKLLHDLGDRRMGREGFSDSHTDSQWILLDYGTVVVHLFDKPTREYFALESLWGEGRRVDWREHALV